MNDSLIEELARLKKHLESLPCRFALVGGLAVTLHVRPRLTKDVDVAIAVATDAEAQAIVRALMTSAYFVSPKGVIENTHVGRMSTVRLRPRDPARLEGTDLLFASSGIEPEVVDAAITMHIGAAGPVGVAQVGHLIATKTLSENSDRPQDRLDLHALLSVATDGDVKLARSSLDLITDRGFNRKLDLQARLGDFIDEFAPELDDGPSLEK